MATLSTRGWWSGWPCCWRRYSPLRPRPYRSDHANGGRLTIGGRGRLTDQPTVPPGKAITISRDARHRDGRHHSPGRRFQFPPVDFTMPLPGRLTTTAIAPATGTLNLATGAMTMNIHFSRSCTWRCRPDCTITPLSFSLTTGAAPGGRYAQGSPRNAATGAIAGRLRAGADHPGGANRRPGRARR